MDGLRRGRAAFNLIEFTNHPGAANPMSAATQNTADERAAGNASAEPSMEEILASIRRIIADEQAATAVVQPIRPDVRVRAPAPAAGPSEAVKEFDAWLARTDNGRIDFSPAEAVAPAAHAEPAALAEPVAPEQIAPEPVAPEPVVAEAAYAATLDAAPAIIVERQPMLERPHLAAGQEAVAANIEAASPVEHFDLRGGYIEVAAEPAPSPVHHVAQSAAHAPAHVSAPQAEAYAPPAAPRLTVVQPEPPVVASPSAAIPPAAPLYDDLDQPLQPLGDAESLLSAMAGQSVQSSFQALARTMFMQNTGVVEEAVRDMLRPMLKQWLDDNLPSVVERLVRAEIERVARGGR